MAEMDDRDDEETPGQEMGIKGMDGWKRIPVDGNSAELDSGNGDEFKDLEGEMEDEEEIVVMHSWQNERKNHMVTQSEPKLIKFPLAYKDSLQKVIFKLHNKKKNEVSNKKTEVSKKTKNS
jgi:hypothetical protein